MLRPDPDSSFWLVPYLLFGAGGILITLMLKRMRGRAHKHALLAASANAPTGGSPGGAEPSLAHYRDAIERDTASLD